MPSVTTGIPAAASICMVIEVPDRGRPESTTTGSPYRSRRYSFFIGAHDSPIRTGNSPSFALHYAATDGTHASPKRLSSGPLPGRTGPPPRPTARGGLHRTGGRIRASVVVSGGLHHHHHRHLVPPHLAVSHGLALLPAALAGEALDPPRDHRGLRRTGPEAHREVHEKGFPPELREAREDGGLSEARDELPLDLARRLVVVRNRHQPGAPQHLRLPRSGSEDVPSAAVVDAHRKRGSLAQDRPPPNSPGESRAKAPPEVEAVLVDPRRKLRLEHRAPGPDYVPSRQVQRSAALGNVRSRSTGDSGDVSPLHHAACGEALQGRRNPGRASAQRRSHGDPAPRSGEPLPRRPPAARDPADHRSRPGKEAGPNRNRRGERRPRAEEAQQNGRAA